MPVLMIRVVLRRDHTVRRQGNFVAQLSSYRMCTAGDLFSCVTGQPCNATQNNSSAVAQFNNLFKNNFAIGVKGNDVKSLQQFLKDEGYYFGKIDG